jgi:TonB-dependent receptor
MLLKSIFSLIVPITISVILFSQEIHAREERKVEKPTSTTPSFSSIDIEEIVVTAKRVEGNGKRQRTAASRDDLDNATQVDMNGFFDEIEGLSTLGADEDGNAFSLDGLSANLANVTLNGQGLGEGRGNGGFSAGNLPPEMILRVDISKTPTPSMEEGGAGGSVNLQLRNPVDIVTVASNVKARAGYEPRKRNLSPSASFFTGRPSESNRYGYMFSMSMSEQIKEYVNQDINQWEPREFEGTLAFIPSQVRNNAIKDNLKSVFAGLSLGYRPHQNLDITGNVFLSRNQKDYDADGLQHRFEKQRNISLLDFDGRTATELESSDPNRKNLRIAGTTREEQTDSLVLGMNLAWRHAKWRINAALGYNSDKNKNDSPSQAASFEANSAFGYMAQNDGSLIMSYLDGFPATRDFDGIRINLNDRNTRDTNKFGGIDVTRSLGNVFIHRIRFGAKTRELTRSRRSDKGRLSLDESLNLSEFFSDHYQQTPWDMMAWPAIDMDAIDDLVKLSQIDWEDNLVNDYDIERQIDAAYLQADFRTGETGKRFLVGNIGARVVGTNTWITGFQETGPSVEPISVKTSYTDILPSFTMRMRIADRAALSFGLAKVMTHPSFNDLAPGIRINDSDKTAKSGNPYLEPFRARQILVDLTWVPRRGLRLKGNLAYRDVASYFALTEESIEFDGDTYLLRKPVNGENGYIFSAGLRLEQNMGRLARQLRNFALSLSYMRNISGTDMRDPYSGEKLPMPDTAERVARAELGYGKDVFSGKIYYQWRGKSLKASVSESGLSVWNQPVGSLNLKLGWKLQKALQLSFDARNLLAEEQIRSTDCSTQLWRITERNRTIAITLRVKW